jgi:Acetyltransferase (GNAT) domain
MLAVPHVDNAGKVSASMRVAQADLSRLPTEDEWSDLARNASEPNPFFEHWFLRPALTFLVYSDIIRLAEFRVGGVLCGIFPLSVRDSYGRSPVRNTGNWAHYQCFLGTPLVRAGYEQQFWLSLFKALDGADWAGDLMSFSGLDPDGPVFTALQDAAKEVGRPAPIVHSFQRALLATELAPEPYLAAHIRGKKRKEWRRLHNRLSEMGEVRFSILSDEAEVTNWCQDFLKLESAGWKGKSGAALARLPETQAFFLDTASCAFREGNLQLQRLDLDGRPIAMLVNFLTPPGSWSFKIAYDEELARFSPGVMIELKNLEQVLESSSLKWMDSCAVENHPMIDSLWAERRTIVQVTVPLSGLKRRAIYQACRIAETGSAAIRKITGK